MDSRSIQIRPYLAQLRLLPFVRKARLAARTRADVGEMIGLTTPSGEVELPVELKLSHLSREVAERLVHVGQRHPGLLVLAPLVGAELGELFVREKINFVDLAGNCHVRIGQQFLAYVQGRRPLIRTPADRGMRAPAFKVLFALLADPELVHATTRALAQAAGSVSPQTAADMRAKLLASGTLLKSRGNLRWARGGWKQALDMFLFAFPHMVSGFMVGRFRSKHQDAKQLEAELTPRLNAMGEWRWGGGAAAQRLTHYYRGDRTMIYLRDGSMTLAQKLPLVPDPDGNVVLMRAIGPLAFESPNPEVVHPLLIYADLMNEAHDRAREAGADIFQRYLSSHDSGT